MSLLPLLVAFAYEAGGRRIRVSRPAARVDERREPRLRRDRRGSGLDTILRAGAITHLVLCGIATSGVVLSTVRAAADLDLELTVLHDACADGDPEVHRVLTGKVFPRQAAVLDVAAWSSGLG